MAERWNRTITNDGINMLANVTDARPLKIVRMACASGSVAASALRTQTALTNEVMDIPITASSQISDTVYEVAGQIDNSEISTGFYLKQVGVFAKLGDAQTEVLFEIAQVADGDSGDRIPAAAESPGFLATYAMDLVFSADTNVEVVIDSGSLAEAKRYTDEKTAPLESRITALEDESSLVLSDSLTFTLPAAGWTYNQQSDCYTQTLYAADIGVYVDNVRGVIGIGNLFNDTAKLKIVAAARIIAEKNGADGIIFKAFGAVPTIDLPIALNPEYDGGKVSNGLISCFPSAGVWADVLREGHVEIGENNLSAFADLSTVTFDATKYSYYVDVTNIIAEESGSIEDYEYPVLAALNINAKKAGFRIFGETSHSDVLTVYYRIVRVPIVAML